MRRSTSIALSTFLLVACGGGRERPAEAESTRAEPTRAEPDTKTSSLPASGQTSAPDKHATPPPPTPETGPFRSRAEMAKLLGSLRKGMPAAEARALLGEPDDVRTELDMGGLVTARTREIWRYGTRGHLSFPTLGRVSIDERDRVQYVYGGEGSPVAEELIAEGELRAYLRVVDRLSSYNAGAGHDPLALIRAVNALQPLGEQRALAVIAEYLRVASSFHDPAYEGTMLLMRVLFTAETIPPMHVGAPSDGASLDPSTAPLFPLILVEDIPLLIVHGYALGGLAEPPSAHLRYFQEHGRVRAALLQPGEHPERLVTTLSTGKVSAPQALLGAQIIRLTRTVYRPSPEFVDDGTAANWAEHEQALSQLGPRWDGVHQEYRNPDGSRLPELEEPLYTRAIWSPENTGADVKLILERRSAQWVNVDVQVMRARQRGEGVFVFGDRRFEIELRPGQSYTQGGGLQLEVGQSVQFTYESGGEIQQGPRMTP